MMLFSFDQTRYVNNLLGLEMQDQELWGVLDLQISVRRERTGYECMMC